MIVSGAFAGKRYAVLGLARSGLATVESLHASGAQVTAWDRRPGPRDAVAAIAAIGDPMEIDLAGFDGVVVSPGVPLNTHPLAERACAAGVPLIGDIELFAQARADLPPHKVVGITGTNGKSTTTALVHHILKVAGIPTTMGGNIGLPILAQEPLPEGGVYVLELSSYQIDLTYSLDCDVAVLLNITPDHLDRYDSFEAYAASKARLFEMQSDEHMALIGGADKATLSVLDQVSQRRPLDPEEAPLPVPLNVRLLTTLPEEKFDAPSLPGPHNRQNISAALMACFALGLGRAEIDPGLRTYPGLPHRMERVAEHNGVLFINDSKATNPASTAPALAAYPRVHWICGGLPKGDDLDECAPHFGHVVAAYTIGEAGPRFAEILEPHMPVERCEMLCEAVPRAMAAAKPGEVILLSPACASFDQFSDYEARGDSFRQIVAGLTGSEMSVAEFAGEVGGMTALRPYIPMAGARAPASPQFPQTRKAQLRIWWREVDRVLLTLVLILMATGSIAVAAASPASARRLSTSAVRLDDLYFYWAHLRWQFVGLLTMIGISMAPRELARRGAIMLGGAMLFALFLVPLVGSEVNGARRWLDVGMRFQPSEFLKPGYAVLLAWILTWKLRDPRLPVIQISAGLAGLVAVLLMAQPNLGDALLFLGAWMVMAMLAGMPMQRIGIIAGSGLGLLALAYLFYDNARHRIDSFIGGGTAFDQVDLASRALMSGGWTGAGLWLGRRKMQLPEAHTDYVFSVIGEEFGLLICAFVVVLYLAIVARVLVRMLEEENLFAVLAAAGLATLFGGQAFINILVNLQLFPSKGMTLPLVSYGGSATIAQCALVGLLLAFTRRNPFLTREGVGITAALPKGLKR